jgi:hypothetical protein
MADSANGRVELAASFPRGLLLADFPKKKEFRTSVYVQPLRFIRRWYAFGSKG